MDNANIDQATDAQKIIGQVSALAMADEAFKANLKADPVSVLSSHGLPIPRGMTVQVLESFERVPETRDPSTLYIVIPGMNDMTQEDMNTALIAAASCQSTASSACTTPSCLSSASTASTQSCS